MYRFMVFLIGSFSLNLSFHPRGFSGAPWTWTFIFFADMDIILNFYGMNE